MIAYITYRFEMHFAIAGVLALFHDIFVVVALFSIFQLEIDSTFIAALLTILGIPSMIKSLCSTEFGKIWAG